MIAFTVAPRELARLLVRRVRVRAWGALLRIAIRMHARAREELRVVFEMDQAGL